MDSFRQLVESASCMIVILRPQESEVCFFNPFAEQLTGHRAADVVGQPFLQLFARDEQSRSDWDRTLRRAGQPDCLRGTGGLEHAISCRDGECRWLQWSLHSLDDFDGQPGLLLVGHDITDRIQAIESLQSERARLKAVLDTAADGIITIDERGVIQSVNAAAESAFGYEASEMVGQNISMLMPPPYRDEHDRYLADYLRTGIKKIIGIGREVQGRRKDGAVFPCDVAVSEVPHQRLFTGIVRDITPQHEAEKERQRAEQRALQAERLAAIGQTVTGLAHESRNAFQRSQACLEMLALELQDRPDELELVDRAQRALSHLHRLYEEVRDYAAPINLDRQPCDLGHLCRDAWSQLELNRKDKRIELRENGAAGDLTCQGDWFSLSQVFRNILENAVSACPDLGRVELLWRSDARLQEQPAVSVSIRDNGPGIPPADRSHVFEAFFTTRPKGTGLGMAIARRIVEAHGGVLELGDCATGAEFVLTLPRAAEGSGD